MSRKILLADDSVTAQNMGRRILTEAGYEVVTVNNGPAALKKLVEFEPDLLILDIYMPGHSGIEVCQKVKENPQTASLPVLLTVGKLEPFKADEARRVRADAHLVKPFEATELLAALIKLEDKIVPRGAVALVAKAAKGKAANAAPVAAKDSKDAKETKDRKFGDSSTGWKQRLTIPSPEAKKEAARQEDIRAIEARREEARQQEANQEEIRQEEARREEAAREAPSTAFRVFTREENQEEDAVATRPAEPSTPEITAEEIAAITAAAAAFGDRSGAFEPGHSAGSVTEEEIAAVVAEVSPKLDALPVMSYSEPAANVAEPAEAAAEVREPVESYQQAAGDSAVASAVAEPSAEPEVMTFAPQPVPDLMADPEVAAMLASLAPVFGEGQNGKGFGSSGGVGASGHASWQAAAGVPRWIAQAVAVDKSEEALILEEEMKQAYAALAEAQAAASFAGDAQVADGYGNHNGGQEASATLHEAYVTRHEAVEAPEIAAVASEPEMAADFNREAEHGIAVAAGQENDRNDLVEAPAPVDEMSSNETSANEMSASVAPAELHEQTPVQEPSEDIAAAQLEESAEPASVVIASGAIADAIASGAVANEEVTSAREESAYAAAASGGTDFRAISHVEATAASSAPAEQQASAATPAVAPEHEAELAAAWAHWRQIRESVASPQFTSQLADVAAAGYKEIHPAQSATPDSAATGDESSAGETDSFAIASIVDSVLAELKPKLVAEIARKLAKEKK